MTIEPGEISRLIYLANDYRPAIPRPFRKFIPHVDILESIAHLGIEGTKVNTGADLGSLNDHYANGARFSEDKGSAEEFRMRVASIVDSALIFDYRSDYSLTERYKLHRQLDSYIQGDDLELVGKAEASLLDDIHEVEGVMKWKTGLAPLDLCFQDGCYQGLHILMGNPGTGKSSIQQYLMETLRTTNAASSIWYFSLETPLNMVRWRMTPIRMRTKFLEDDRIIAGITSVDEVIERIRENPDPDRVILYDGPDVMSAGSSDGRRFVLEDIFRQLVQVKQMCKAVFVPSQPRRGEQAGLSLESVAESWSKAWYSDTVFGIEALGGEHNGKKRMKITNFKNRFGPMGHHVYFNVDWENFTHDIDETNLFPTQIGGTRDVEPGEGDY